MVLRAIAGYAPSLALPRSAGQSTAPRHMCSSLGTEAPRHISHQPLQWACDGQPGHLSPGDAAQSVAGTAAGVLSKAPTPAHLRYAEGCLAAGGGSIHAGSA
jgi:hypothetical protein